MGFWTLRSKGYNLSINHSYPLCLSQCYCASEWPWRIWENACYLISAKNTKREGAHNWPNSQIPEFTCSISHNAPFRTEMWIHLCSEWSMVGYGTGALWDLWNWSILWKQIYIHGSWLIEVKGSYCSIIKVDKIILFTEPKNINQHKNLRWYYQHIFGFSATGPCSCALCNIPIYTFNTRVWYCISSIMWYIVEIDTWLEVVAAARLHTSEPFL